MKGARLGAVVAAALGTGLPGAARACSVCRGGASEESAFAFILMTVFMSGLPLALIGGVAWFLRRAHRQREARTQARLQGLAPEGPTPR